MKSSELDSELLAVGEEKKERDVLRKYSEADFLFVENNPMYLEYLIEVETKRSIYMKCLEI